MRACQANPEQKGASLSPSTGQDSPSNSRQQLSEPEDNEEGGEQDAGAEVGSIGSLDEVAVDVDQVETRGIGHLGKSSAANWQHRTEEIAAEDLRSKGNKSVPHVPSISSYHTDDADLEYFDTSSVNMFALPSPQLSGALVQSYFDNIHNVSPMLNKADFLFKYQAFPKELGSLTFDDVMWLACLNCVFAIAAYHGRLIKDFELGNPGDHMIYLTRATMICAKQEILLKDASVSSVTMLGLLVVYYMATSRINK